METRHTYAPTLRVPPETGRVSASDASAAVRHFDTVSTAARVLLRLLLLRTIIAPTYTTRTHYHTYTHTQTCARYNIRKPLLFKSFSYTHTRGPGR